MRELLALLAIGVGTYAMRAAFLVSRRTEPPPRAARLLPLVGPAVLAAITVPALVAPSGAVSPSGTSAGLLAALATWLLWRRRQRLPLALFGGLACWWVTSTFVVPLLTG